MHDLACTQTLKYDDISTFHACIHAVWYFSLRLFFSFSHNLNQNQRGGETKRFYCCIHILNQKQRGGETKRFLLLYTYFESEPKGR